MRLLKYEWSKLARLPALWGAGPVFGLQLPTHRQRRPLAAGVERSRLHNQLAVKHITGRLGNLPRIWAPIESLDFRQNRRPGDGSIADFIKNKDLKTAGDLSGHPPHGVVYSL